MDCRQTLDILDGLGTTLGDVPPHLREAAEAHVGACPRCAATVGERARFDERIALAMRAVDVPAEAKARLLERVRQIERSEAAAASSVAVAMPDHMSTRRSFTRRAFFPVAICTVVAAAGFFGMIWLVSPRYTVDAVRQELARIDFESLEASPAFNGSSLCALPGEWQRLSLLEPRGYPPAARRHAWAIYGFAFPDRDRRQIRGLVAVIPRSRISTPPEGQSPVSMAAEYVSALIGESASVAWTSGDVVCVCLVQGGADSIAALQAILAAPAA